jgi:hypothetical protein
MVQDEYLIGHPAFFLLHPLFVTQHHEMSRFAHLKKIRKGEK